MSIAATQERQVARRVWRRWVHAQGWSTRELASLMGVGRWRAQQVWRARLLPSLAELARMGPYGASYLATLARALRG